MAYPTGMLSLTLEEVDRRASALKVFCQQAVTRMAAGNVTSNRIFDVYLRLIGDKATFQAAAATPGIAQYAKDQKGNQSLNIAAEFTAMLAAMDNVINWVSTNFPKDGSGYLLAQTLEANGPVDRQFTPAQTASFRTVLNSLIATID